MSGSGIMWAICKSALRSRQITMPAPHYSVFYRPDALPATQPTASKHWRQHTSSVKSPQSTRQRMLDSTSRPQTLRTWITQLLQLHCCYATYHSIPLSTHQTNLLKLRSSKGRKYSREEAMLVRHCDTSWVAACYRHQCRQARQMWSQRTTVIVYTSESTHRLCTVTMIQQQVPNVICQKAASPCPFPWCLVSTPKQAYNRFNRFWRTHRVANTQTTLLVTMAATGRI